jgi:carbon storage regulator
MRFLRIDAIFNQGGTPMLVLTRRVGETVVIDGDIQVTVVAVQGSKIRLGITAPDYVRVDRQEVHDSRLSGEGNSVHRRDGEVATC